MSSAFSSIVRELESRGMMPNRPPGLETTLAGISELGLKINPSKVILVAGTNGKGTTASYLESLLLSAGESVGLFTSPHLVSTTERIRLNGRDISENEFVDLFNRVDALSDKIDLSHFEALTLMSAVQFFERNRVDRAIFEVGLGGTWDATNAIPHETLILTSLGYDHQNILGDTIQEIAANKFGAIRSETKRVIAAPLPDAVDRPTMDSSVNWTERAAFDFTIRNGTPEEPIPTTTLQFKGSTVELPLTGKRSAENAALAATAFEAFGFSFEEHSKALTRTQWLGRLSKEHFRGRDIWLSGDHNAQGAQSLAEILSHSNYKTLRLMVGIGEHKDVDSILSSLVSLPRSEFSLTETPFQTRSLSDYPQPWTMKAKRTVQNPIACLSEIVSDSKEGDLIVVTGSLYLIGEILGATRG